jgi:hypothetical protein
VLLDLTAGGFDWGPALGGEGVVHKHTLPNMMDFFSKAAELKTSEAVRACKCVGCVSAGGGGGEVRIPCSALRDPGF